jgi:hypothetical protein
MRSSKKNLPFRCLAALAVAALLLVGCNDSSPTEPKLGAAPTPAPTPAPMFTGTYNGISARCDSSAQANFQDTPSGSSYGLSGTMTVPCLNSQYPFGFFGDFQGNTFTGFAMWGDPEFYPLKGTLSGSSLEITIFNETGGTQMGQLHLHR